MSNQPTQTDNTVKGKLRQLTGSRPFYWSYEANSRRADSFDYFQYPAMMVPEMLRDLIGTIIEAEGSVHSIFDPFAGSGSVLIEAMFQGLRFSGADINPLAVLLCKMKAGPFLETALESRIEELTYCIESDQAHQIEAEFPNIEKWFHPRALRELSVIRRAIRGEPSLWCRRFFWIALAETVRRCSNSRTSTYKLHIRDKADLKARRNLSPIEIFDDILTENFLTFSDQTFLLRESRLLQRGRYIKEVQVRLSDARTCAEQSHKFDLLITSPPYGDNATTVPYGQHSYLPLQWIDFEDIDEHANRSCLETTHGIDSRSLGGLRSRVEPDIEQIISESPSFRRIIAELKDEPKDRTTRVITFARDLHRCIAPILKQLRKHAYMIWVIGNRRVGGREIPTSRILQEFLEDQGAIYITTVDRVIPSKRMANKNSISKTMSREKILILRKQ